jgi:hypothetical protein
MGRIFQPDNFSETSDYNEKRFIYGRSPEAAVGERNRYVGGAGAVDARQGPQIDQAAQNQTRGLQMGSLASLQGAANGTAPSRAEALGNQMADRSLRSQVSAAGNVRGGPGAQAAAYRSAAQGAASQRADAAQGIQAERASEIATARGQFAQAAAGARGQDIGLATDQARMNQQQTAMNDSRAMGYEQMGQNVMQAQLGADISQQQLLQHSQDVNNQIQLQSRIASDQGQRDDAKIMLGAGAGLMGGMASMASDPQAKVPTMGSLASLDIGGVPSGGYGGASALSAQQQPAGLTATQGAMGGAIGGQLAGSMMSAMQSKVPMGSSMMSAMQAKTPSPYMTSDEEAKRKAGPLDGSSGLMRWLESETDGAEPYKRKPDMDLPGRGYRHAEEGPDYLKPKAAETKETEVAKYWKPTVMDRPSTSDESAKDPILLGAPPGHGLRQDADGHGSMVREDLTVPPVHPAFANRESSDEKPKPKTRAKGKAAARKMTDDEMMREADRMMGGMKSDHEKRMAQGPAVKFDTMPDRDMADAMRSMEPSPYAYKPDFAQASGQAPGEVNVGPMANKMAKDPVARTAITRDPETGLLAIDKDKGLKVVMGSLASLQDQVDDMKNDVPRAARAKKARRDGPSAHS